VKLSSAPLLLGSSAVLLFALLFCNAASPQHSVTDQMRQGLQLFQAGDAEGAAALFQEIITQEPNHGPARLMLGQIELERGEVQQAQEHLQIAVASKPQRIHLAWHLLGKAQLLQHQYEPARQSFENSLKEAPNFIPAALWRARANLFLNQIETAINELQNLNDPEAKLLLGEILLYQNNKEKAQQIFSGMNEPVAKLFLKASEKDLENLLGENLGLADAYLAAAIQFKSNEMLQVAYQIDDQNPVTRLFLQRSGKNIPNFSLFRPRLIQTMAVASQALNEKRFDEAETLAKKILADRPMHVPALLIQIESAEKQGKNWEALEAYKKITQWLPDVPAISTRLAILARNVQANEAAECAIRKAIASKPEDASLHYILSTILKQQEKTDEAIAECKRAIEMGFQEAAAYVNLGNLYYEKMDIAKSIETLESAIQKDPEAAEDIAGFALSVLTASDSIQLREILEKYAEDHPENINTLYSLGVLYLNQNQFDKAKDYFVKVQKLAPKNSQVYYNLGLIYTREGNEAEAKKAMSRFEELKANEREEWLKMNQAFRTRQEAEGAIQKGDYKKAIELYTKIDLQGIAEKEDLLALGELQIKTEEIQHAASTFEKTLQKWPYEVKAIKGRLETATQLKNSEDMDLYRNQLELLSSICK
jgi:tetratricopeptide (TPR) repeat protein